jgi:hypothetical protein
MVPPTPTPPPVAVELRGQPAAAESVREPPSSARPRPRKRSFGLAATPALLALAALVLTGLSAAVPRAAALAPRLLASLATQVQLVHLASAPPPVEALPEPPPEPAAEPPPRADAHVRRAGYAPIPGGVLFVPSTFTSGDGAYDLYLHFHGNPGVVRESAEYAGLDAIVAVVNLGVNSAPYLDAYAVPGTYELLLGSIDHAVAERGLEHPRLRKVAIGSWSGGYGAVSRVLEHGRGLGSLDAVLVLDGIHCGFLEDDPKALNTRIISPFLGAAKKAAEGKILFSITHSEIDPIAYAGTNLTAGYLLDAVHGQRGEPLSVPEHVALRAAEGAVSKKLEKWMEPVSEALVGTFHVRGYRGNTPEHHMAHLLQMGATVLPELAERWRPAP